MSRYLGIGKTLFNSNCCLLTKDDCEIFITERFTRKKYDGSWPIIPLKQIEENDFHKTIFENRDVVHPKVLEEANNKTFPFYEMLKAKGLEAFSSHFNPNLKYLSHHQSHSFGALYFSPYEKCHILVIDGAGSEWKDLSENEKSFGDPEQFECLSLYEWDGQELKLVYKEFLFFKGSSVNERRFSNGIGLFYEDIADFIFGDKMASGKVMGLSSFGKGEVVDDFFGFLDELDWTKKWSKKDSKKWELSPNMDLYQDLASTAQLSYENWLFDKIKSLKSKFNIENLVFTGGCALNCLANFKLIKQELVDQVFIPPNPSDLGIGLGNAVYGYYLNQGKLIKGSLSPYLGSRKNTPKNNEIEKLFSEFKIDSYSSIEEKVAELLNDNKVIAWFQGRSECGPRALGNRSILASPFFKGIKKYLNDHIKFREDFRPYGCSVLCEDSEKYFNHGKEFQNPYMSFAVQVKKEFEELLSEVLHIDKTNRMQMVSSEINPRFHNLLKCFKEKSGHGVLLNTSLNIMGEPIVETLEDMKNFLINSKVDYIVIGDYLIAK